MTISPKNPKNPRKSEAFVDNYLLYQMAATSHLISREFHTQLKNMGVKVHVWRVLGCVVDQPGLMLTELAKLVLYEQSRLTKIIDQMVDEGLVIKNSVSMDRRKISIHITPKGKKIVTPLLIKAAEHERKVLEFLSITERADLKKLLGKLTRHLKSD